MKSVKDKHIVVIGAAKSGVAVAQLLHRKGARVFVTDGGVIKPMMRSLFDRASIAYEEKGHSYKAESGDFAVVSPGVPTEAELVQTYLNSERKIYSEIEVASWFCSSPILAITGSNGKTTTANWMAHVRKIAGKSHILAGNIGVAFSDTVDHTAPKTDLVLEVSSFQLDHIDSFKAEQSILLNITPDHLNRYDNSFEKYARSKFRITENQQAGDSVIYWADDNLLKNHCSQLIGPEVFSFSDTSEVNKGAFVRDQGIYLNADDGEEEYLMPISQISLPGRHNLLNSMATAISSRISGIESEYIRESLSTYSGTEHRLELVREKDGIRFYNDSKATNVSSVWFAIESFNVPIVLIMGGQDKGNDYSSLAEKIKEKVHLLLVIGEAAQSISDQLKYAVPNVIHCAGMEEAINKAYLNAKKGEVVLLSPACASFDMFENYESRGNIFKSIVNSL